MTLDFILPVLLSDYKYFFIVMRVLFPFVGDSVEYKNEQNKSKGYSVIDGKKESVINQGLKLRGEGKKN